jgi:hypothetical protein
MGYSTQNGDTKFGSREIVSAVVLLDETLELIYL